MAVLAIFWFYLRLKVELKPIGGVRKLFVLKVLIGIVVLQATIMTMVVSAGAIKATETINKVDYSTGLLNVLTCCEMFIFAPFFLWAYGTGPYKKASGSDYQNILDDQEAALSKFEHKFSPILVLWQAVNLTDLLSEILYAVRSRSQPKPNAIQRSTEELRRVPKDRDPSPATDYGLPVSYASQYQAPSYGQYPVQGYEH